MKEERSGGILSRRDMIRGAVGSLLGASLIPAIEAPMLNRGRFRLFAQSPDEYSERAIRLVSETTVLDMLAPFGPESSEWLRDPTTFSEGDFEKYRDSGINVFHVASGASGPQVFENVLTRIARWNGLIAAQSERLMRIDGVRDLDRVLDSGRVGILFGIQNSEHFRTTRDVELFYSLGQRVSQLTYNTQNRIGAGCMEERDGGLSYFGADVVSAMNEVGMVVDVGHCGDQTTLDAFEASSKPVLVTHANVRALVPGYRRNKTDEAIRRMAATGGVMGLTAVRSFVRDREPTGIEHLLDHYDYVARLVGVEFVGIGTDKWFEGYDSLPDDARANLGSPFREEYAFRDLVDIEELRHPKRTFDLTEGLIRRGYSDVDIQGILGGNFQRVLADIWAN